MSANGVPQTRLGIEKLSKGTQHVPDETRVGFSWRKLPILGLAAVFFTIGVLGVFLPVLPATPFLLLTSYCLVRSSPRLNAALLHSRLFGPILVDWQVHGGVRTHVRLKSIVAVVIAVAITIYLSGFSLVPTLVVVSLAMVGIAVILRLPAAKESERLDVAD